MRQEGDNVLSSSQIPRGGWLEPEAPSKSNPRVTRLRAALPSSREECLHSREKNNKARDPQDLTPGALG